MSPRLLDLLPPHETYVEPYAGGASLLFAKPASQLEVLNDLHDGVTTLYHVLRDPTLFAKFRRQVELTPYTRPDWRSSEALWAKETEPLAKAVAFFIASRMSFTGHPGRTGWRYSIKPDGHAVLKYLGAIDRLPEIHQRLRAVQVDCRPALEVLAIYDRPATLFYVDPPYVMDVRTGDRYDFEMTLEDHAALCEVLMGLDGMVVLSGYDHPVYDPLSEAGWERRAIEQLCWSGNRADGMRAARTEIVWRNPAAVKAWQRARAQQPLFAEAGVR